MSADSQDFCEIRVFQFNRCSLLHALLAAASEVSATKHRQYKSRTSDIHARLYLHTLASNLADVYDIPLNNPKAGITFGDILAAKRSETASRKPGAAIHCELPQLFTETHWQLLVDLNDFANGRVHSTLGMRNGKPFMVCPQEFYVHKEEIQEIVCLVNITMEVGELIVEDESRVYSGFGKKVPSEFSITV